MHLATCHTLKLQGCPESCGQGSEQAKAEESMLRNTTLHYRQRHVAPVV